MKKVMFLTGGSRVHWCAAGTLIMVTAVGCVAASGAAKAPETAPTTAKAAAPSAPTTAPSLQTFQDPSGLLRISYPSDWSVQHDPDYDLTITSGPELFTVNIPDLPPHIPGMIPLGLVVNGYEDDLRKAHPGIKIDEESSPAVPKAKSRRLHSTWSAKNVPTAEIATLMVHGDHVLIVRIVCPTDQLAAARTTDNGIIGSLKWLK